MIKAETYLDLNTLKSGHRNVLRVTRAVARFSERGGAQIKGEGSGFRFRHQNARKIVYPAISTFAVEICYANKFLLYSY